MEYQEKVSILVPTYNGWVRVHQLLQNIKMRTPTDIPYDIIVCDDSGKPEHRARTEEVCKSLGAKFVYHKVNRGVPSAWNTLVKASDAKYLILLNDDVLVAKDWLIHPWFALRNNPKVGSFGLPCFFITSDDVPTLLSSPDAKVIPLNVRWEGGKLITHERFPFIPPENYSGPGRMMCPTGCAFGFRREIWEMVGGFDEMYKAFYEESLPGYEFTLVRDSINGTRLMSFEELYNESITNKKLRFSCLSATVNTDSSAAFLTEREKEAVLNPNSVGGTKEALKRAKEKMNNAMRIDGCWKPVNKIIRHTRTNNIVHVRQKNGSVFVTENHSMVLPTRDEGFIITKPGSFISESVPRIETISLKKDCLKFDLGSLLKDWDQYREDDSEMWYLGYNSLHEPSSKRESIHLPRIVDLSQEKWQKFCWLLGFYVAEGSTSITSNYGALNIALGCNANKELVDKVCDIWKETIGTHTRIAENPGKKEGWKTVYTVWTSHKLVGNLLMKLCGHGSRSKQIPDFIWDSPIPCKEAFIEGYIAGDGLRINSKSSRKESKSIIHLETVSRKLAVGLSILLTSLNMNFAIQYRPKYDSYVLRTKNQFNGHRDSKVVESASIQTEYVYDLEVDGTHVFSAGVGPVVVHNTDFGVACSYMGYPSFQMSFPNNYHMWSQTFKSAPEINAGKIMKESRTKFVNKWSKKLGITFTDAPDIHNLIMDKIPLIDVRWLDERLLERVDWR